MKEKARKLVILIIAAEDGAQIMLSSVGTAGRSGVSEAMRLSAPADGSFQNLRPNNTYLRHFFEMYLEDVKDVAISNCETAFVV